MLSFLFERRTERESVHISPLIHISGTRYPGLVVTDYMMRLMHRCKWSINTEFTIQTVQYMTRLDINSYLK